MTANRYVVTAVIVAGISVLAMTTWWLFTPTSQLHISARLIDVEVGNSAPGTEQTLGSGSVAFVELSAGSAVYRYQTLFGDPATVTPATNMRDQQPVDPASRTEPSTTVPSNSSETTAPQPLADTIVSSVLLPAIPLVTATQVVLGPIEYVSSATRVVSVDPRSPLDSLLSPGDEIIALATNFSENSSSDTVTEYPTPDAQRLIDALTLIPPGSQIGILLADGTPVQTTLDASGALGLTLETYRVPAYLPTPAIPLQVASPSGALATALVILDELEPRDLVNSRSIVAMAYMDELGVLLPVSDPQLRAGTLPNDIDLVIVHTSQTRYFEAPGVTVVGFDTLADVYTYLLDEAPEVPVTTPPDDTP